HGIELAEGAFKPVLPQFSTTESKASRDKVKRIVLGTGKVMVDLEEALSSVDKSEYDWLRQIRVEQLYPFPADEIARLFKLFSKLEEIIWLQEEPKNMGSWFYMEPKLWDLAPKGVTVQYIGRQERASTASGHQEVHVREQQAIITAALDGKLFESKTVRR